MDNINSIPVLGSVPYLRKFSNLRDTNKSIIKDLDSIPLEKYLYLYDVLLSVNKVYPIRSLAITSAESQDGKSLTSILLAKAFSSFGQRVLLIDADITKKHIHSRLGIENKFGLCEILKNKESSIHKGIHTINKNLKVITSGHKYKNAPDLLFSKENLNIFNQKLFELKDIDLIIYDFSPVKSIDSYSNNFHSLRAFELVVIVDALLMLVNKNYSTERMYYHSIKKLLKKNIFILGLIINSRIHKKYQSLVSAYERTQ